MPRSDQEPLPLDPPPNPHRMAELCRIPDFTGALGATYLCPVCEGEHRQAPVLNSRINHIEARDTRKRTLRLFPTFGNDFGVHCWNCGILESALAFSLQRPDPMGRSLEDFDLFDGHPVERDWYLRAQAWHRFKAVLKEARAGMRNPPDSSPEIPDVYRYLEAGLIHRDRLRSGFPQMEGLSNCRRTWLFLRIVRTLHGLPAYAVVEVAPYQSVARYFFHPMGPIALEVPTWSPYFDWRQELVLSSSLDVAATLDEIIRDGSEDRPPLPRARIIGCRGPIHEEMPARVMTYVPDQQEPNEFALAFCNGSSAVRVHRLGRGNSEDRANQNDPFFGEDAIEATADEIEENSTSDSHSVAWLDAILSKPWIGEHARRQLTTKVASRIGERFEEIVDESGIRPWTLPYIAELATFLCRNGVYLKSTNHERTEFEVCSNFSLRIEQTMVRDGESLQHRLALRMGHRRTHFEIEVSRFLKGHVLLSDTIRVAHEAGWPELPKMMCRGGVGILPMIVENTQLAPTPQCTEMQAWGFTAGQFEGPDYTVSSRGFRFQRERLGPPSTVRLLSREATVGDMVSGEEYLRWAAARFFSWLELRADRALLQVLLCAAWVWLHRAAKGMPSFLALKNRKELLLFSEMLGIQPIEVGMEQDSSTVGVPKVMDSCFWSLKHFQRQGWLVAAIEEERHYLDPRVICVVHGETSRESEGEAECPVPILGLLAYSVLSSGTLEEGIHQMVGLLDDANLREFARQSFEAGAKAVVEPRHYLEVFLSHLDELEREVSTGGESFWLLQSKRKGVQLIPRARLENSELKHFDIHRVAQEIQEKTGLEQPLDRYGKERTPVLVVPETLIAGETRAGLPFGTSWRTPFQASPHSRNS